jgi:polyhydroxybutyrate depolymerase
VRHLLLLLLLVPLALTGCPDGDDDDSALPGDDDDDAVEPQLCPEDPSTGDLPPDGGWLEVEGWGTPGDGIADREIWVHPPSGDGPAPLAVFVAGRSVTTREAVEEQVAEAMGLAAWGDAADWAVAVVLPGPAELESLGWYVGSQDDLDYFGAALDRLEAAFVIDRNRIHLAGHGEGGRIALYLAWAFGGRIASVIDFAGPSPWPADPPETWERPVPALFIHGPGDALVPISAMEAAAAIFEEAGAPVHTFFDYPVGHAWDPSVGGELQAAIAQFVTWYCLEPGR